MPPKGSKRTTTKTTATTTTRSAALGAVASSTTVSSHFVPQEEYGSIVPTLCALGERLDCKVQAVEREIHELEQIERQLLQDRVLLKRKIAAMEE